MGSTALMPIGMALVGPAAELFGERNLLIGASIFHIIAGLSILRIPGVKDMKMPRKTIISQGEQDLA
jgi:hypothetical protein